MQTYWDLTEKERAELTREQVESFVAIELMTHGKIAAEPPAYEPEPPLPELKTSRYYSVGVGRRGALLFASLDDATAYLALPFRICETVYPGGNYDHDRRVDFAAHCEREEITVVELPDRNEVDRLRGAIDERGAVMKRNDALRKEYETALREQAKALEEMWTEWGDLQTQKAQHAKVRDTFRKYTELSDGDHATARRFLLEAFHDQDVEAAEAWFGEKFGAADEEAA